LTNQTQYVIIKETGTLGEKMSETTVIDAEIEETEATEITLEDRVETLESHIKNLYEQHKSILDHLRGIVLAVSEVANVIVTEEE